jgi:tetratricopeptide (TPR) repeat protein
VDTPEAKADTSPRISFRKRMENFLEQVEVFRKLLLNFLVLLVVTALVFFLLRTAAQKRLLIVPVEIPESVKKMGYTPESITAKIADRINFIKRSGSEYYQSNNISLSMSDEPVELVNTLLANTPLSNFKEAVITVVNTRQKRAVGKIIQLGNKLELNYTIGEKNGVTVQSGSIDSLVNSAAEYIMETADPYYLGAYYFQQKKFPECLQLIQRLLNSGETENKYLALHIRGNVYIEMGGDYAEYAKTILENAIASSKIKSPWLTYNSMGALYHNRGELGTAKTWYRNSINANAKGSLAYYNYGNILVDEYRKDSIRYRSSADSAVYYFKQAIAADESNIKYYMGVLLAYALHGNMTEARPYFFKCLDMDPGNKDLYLPMADIANYNHDAGLGNKYLQIYDSLEKLEMPKNLPR